MTVSQRGNVVAALFQGATQGECALTDLKAAGFTRVELSQVGGDDEPAQNAPAQETEPAAIERPFFQEHDSHASSFVDELVKLGFSKRDSHDLVDGLVEGATLVTADAANDLDSVVAIFSRNFGDIRYTVSAHDDVQTSPLADMDQHVQLLAEKLVVNKRRVQHGEARVRKEIVTEMRTIEVPVSHEELVIERHAVMSDGIVAAEPLTDQTIRIPLTEETISISKQTIVREQVEIGTRRIENVAHVSETVRHEELSVDGASIDDRP